MLQDELFAINRALRRDKRKLETLATPQNNGLLSSLDKEKLDGLFSGRTLLEGETDILSVGPGFYYGAGLTNTPTTANGPWFIDVLQRPDGRNKEIWAFEVATGRKYHKEIVVNGDSLAFPKGWSRQKNETVIWAGDSIFSEGTSITLTENYSNFDALRYVFVYRGQNFDVYISQKSGVAENIPTKHKISAFAISDNPQSNNTVLFHAKGTIAASGATLTMGNIDEAQITFNGGSVVFIPPTNNGFTLKAVYGIK